MSDEMTLAETIGFTWSDAMTISEMAFDLVEAGNLDSAITLFHGLLALNPKHAAIQAALGAVYEKQGRLVEAEQAYSEAIEQNPETVLARVNRGALRLRRGDRSGMDDLQVAAGIESAVKEKAEQLLKTFAN